LLLVFREYGTTGFLDFKNDVTAAHADLLTSSHIGMIVKSKADTMCDKYQQNGLELRRCFRYYNGFLVFAKHMTLKIYRRGRLYWQDHPQTSLRVPPCIPLIIQSSIKAGRTWLNPAHPMGGMNRD
jgi:hypothetical protein